jgi:hypothetical protein
MAHSLVTLRKSIGKVAPTSINAYTNIVPDVQTFQIPANTSLERHLASLTK